MHLEKRKTIKLLPNFCSDSSDANLSVSSPSINETFDLTSLIENSENRDVSRCLSRRLKIFQDFKKI